MLFIVVGLILGIIGHYAALISVAESVIASNSFRDFIKKVQQKFYSLTIVVIIFSMFFDTGFFMALATTYVLTLCLIDYEDTYDNLLKES